MLPVTPLRLRPVQEWLQDTLVLITPQCVRLVIINALGTACSLLVALGTALLVALFFELIGTHGFPVMAQDINGVTALWQWIHQTWAEMPTEFWVIMLGVIAATGMIIVIRAITQSLITHLLYTQLANPMQPIPLMRPALLTAWREAKRVRRTAIAFSALALFMFLMSIPLMLLPMAFYLSRYSLTWYFIVVERRSLWDATTASAAATRHYEKALLLRSAGALFVALFILSPLRASSFGWMIQMMIPVVWNALGFTLFREIVGVRALHVVAEQPSSIAMPPTDDSVTPSARAEDFIPNITVVPSTHDFPPSPITEDVPALRHAPWMVIGAALILLSVLLFRNSHCAEHLPALFEGAAEHV